MPQLPGNTSIEKSKCDSTNGSINSNSVSKLFYGLLNSKSGLDLIRTKKCQQNCPTSNNPQLRRSFKLLKAHRSESNLPFKQSQQSNQQKIISNQSTNQFNTQFNQTKSTLSGSLGDLKMKSNQSLINDETNTLLTTAQIANVISSDDSLPPTPPLRNSSLQQRLNQPNHRLINHQFTNYSNRELPSLPIVKNDEKRKSISFSNRLSPNSDGGFNSFDYSSSNKRNSISVLNHRNFNQIHSNPNTSNLISPNNQSINLINPSVNKYSALINNTTPTTNVFHSNYSSSSSSSNNLNEHNLNKTSINYSINDNRWNNFDTNFQENNLNSNHFNSGSQRNNFFTDVDQTNLDLDYQNINANANNYALSSQKSDNWSSSTSVQSTYTGITSSSTSDYYTASSETITNSPSLSSLNSALCGSSINTCNSPPLNNNCKVNNLNRLNSGSSIVNNNIGTNNIGTNLSFMRQFSYPCGSQLSSVNNSMINNSTMNNSTMNNSTINNSMMNNSMKLTKTTALPNTNIAISSLVEKPIRQESASVLYYIVAKDSNTSTTLNSNSDDFSKNKNDVMIAQTTKEQLEQQVDKENILRNKNTSFNESSSSYLNESHFNKFSNTNGFIYQTNNNSMSMNEKNHLQTHHQSTDLSAIQKSLNEFYLRHRGANLKDNNQLDHIFKQTKSDEKMFNHKNLINYSLTSNDSCSDSSISPTDSPILFQNLPSIQLPAKPNYLKTIKKLTPEEEKRLNEIKANAIYTNINTNINYDQLNELEMQEMMESNGHKNCLKNSSKEHRLSFRERLSPFEKNHPIKQINNENKSRNELKNLNLNQPNNVKNIAKQFDNLSNLNCDLNANRVSPVSINKLTSGNAINCHQLNANRSPKESTNRSMKSDNFNEKHRDEQIEKLNALNCISNENSDEDADKKENINNINNRSETNDQNGQLDVEDLKMKLKENEEKIKLFLEYLLKNELNKMDYNKIIQHIEEVDKVTKLMISLSNRLKKIENILQLRSNQQNNEQNEQMNDSQMMLDANKFKQSTSTDSLLNDEKNLFSSILSLSSISLNNLSSNGSAFFASIEMLNSKKNKILDQLDEANQLKQMIERRCINLNDRIIGKQFDFTQIDFDDDNQQFNLLKNFNFIDSMQFKHKHELSLKCREF